MCLPNLIMEESTWELILKTQYKKVYNAYNKDQKW